MKGILFVLYWGLFVGGDLFGQIRIHIDSLKHEWSGGNQPSYLFYYKGKIFSGICFQKDELNQLGEFEIKNGRTDGFIKSYYPNGQLKHLSYEHPYKDLKTRKIDSREKHWYENGQLKSEKVDEEGKGVSRWWYKNGQLEYFSITTINELNRIDENSFETSKHWYENGQLESERKLHYNEFIQLQQHGTQKLYYDNGQLHYEENYNMGKYHGLYKSWYKDGRIMYETNLVDGNGVIKEYYQNGSLKMEKNLKHLIQIEKHWYENGQLKSEQTEYLDPNLYPIGRCFDEYGNEIDSVDISGYGYYHYNSEKY